MRTSRAASGFALAALLACTAAPAARAEAGSDAAAPAAAAEPVEPVEPAPAEAAPADSSDFEMDRVIITGTRVRTKLIDLPFAVDRVSMQDAPYERKVAVDDVLDEIPGLFLQSRYGNHDVRISIRGFGSRSNTGIRGVRILLDGIPESEPDGQTRIEAIDFRALGSIEVVRGNASSIYTNAPGGVINFISDLDFRESFWMQFNQVGAHELRQNGFKTGIRTDEYGLLTTYSYHNAQGYREHSGDYWHTANVALETNPREASTLRLYAYVADGQIRLPGSLTREQFDEDPWQANARDVSRDTKRISRKGRLGIRWESRIGDDEVELTAYSAIKYFERTASTYRLLNRDHLGASVRYVNRHRIGGLKNEVSGAVDWFFQWGPIQEYENINGKKGDILLGITDESIDNTGFYVANSLELVPDRLTALVTARYDDVTFVAKNNILEVQNATRDFHDFTPKAALNFKITPMIAAFTSYGLGFDVPAGNEMDNFPTSTNPNVLLNPDLKPQQSRNFELGVKGGVLRWAEPFLKRAAFSATFFAIRVEDEIVPFDVFGDVFYRNSAETDRKGLEFGVDAELVEGLTFKCAYTLSDFEYRDYAAGTVVIDTTGNFVLDDDDFSGNVVPSVPRHHTSLSLAYQRDLAARVAAFTKVQWSVTSGMFVDDANSEKADGYRLLDPSAGLDLTLGPVDVLLSGGVNNVLDETYVGFVNINSASGQFYEAGEPRSWYLGLDVGGRF